MITVIQPGLYTTVQDRGRFGFYGVGFPPSGSMDLYSSAVANILVGNPANAAVLETTFVGPTLEFERNGRIAVTGATADITIDGVSIQPWTSIEIKKGQVLAFGGISAGVRNYLAISGGIGVQPVMGSRSTYVASNLGGVEGRALLPGDRLEVLADSESHTNRNRFETPEYLRVSPLPHHVIRIVPGLCNYLLDPKSQQLLTAETFTVSTEANRTGYRLTGHQLNFIEREQPFGAGSDPSNVVNLGYPVGSLQAPSGTELICLMRDAVTGGGYATLATVISVDLDILAQMKFPETVSFEAISMEAALQLRAQRGKRLQSLVELIDAVT